MKSHKAIERVERMVADSPEPTGRNLKLAEWLHENHDSMKLLYFDDWAEIVAEKKPLIKQLMARAQTDNPLSAVLPVCETIPASDISRLLLLAVATEMITRRKDQ